MNKQTPEGPVSEALGEILWSALVIGALWLLCQLGPVLS
jgi:hypothetical protein